MAFGIGVNTQKTEVPKLPGEQVDIACECWFTSKGHIRPLMLKYQDGQGEIHTIREILIWSEEEKNYAGIPSIEFAATLTYEGRERNVKLIYYKEECRWVISL